MKNLETLAIGDVIEVRFKIHHDGFKSHSDYAGYVAELPDSHGIYLGVKQENPLLPKYYFEFDRGMLYLPIKDMEEIIVLRKANRRTRKLPFPKEEPESSQS